MRSSTLSCLLLCLLVSSSVAKLPTYNIDPKSLTTGGLSSGAFMAVQVHFAFSKTIKGAAITAGGPFWCAQGNTSTALTTCMSSPLMLNVETLNTKAKALAKSKDIDDLSNLSGSKVYVFSGTKDDVVKPDVVKGLQKQYQGFGATVKSVYDVQAEHAYITTNFGNKCAFKGTPYINNCNYSMAWDALTTLYGTLNEPVAQVSSNVISFDQSPYIPTGSSMGAKGYLYVPTACQSKANTCKLSIQFHGCQQTLADIGTDYVTKLGLNEIAESNNIIILYPQAKASTMSPSNPNGCWDWFGYTGSLMDTTSYVTKKGKQMNAVWSMVTDLVGSDPENLQSNSEESEEPEASQE